MPRRYRMTGIILLALVVIGYAGASYFVRYIPLNQLPLHQKPEQRQEKVYDYYVVVDEENQRELMYVPLLVSAGDELITEDNKLYRVIRVKDNIAYAQFQRTVDLSNPASRP